MQALEAMTHLIKAADEVASARRHRAELNDTFEITDAEREEARKEAEDISVAAAICQAMLNTALPVARYRAFVEVDRDQPKRSKFQESVAPRDEFTICGVTMDNIIAGLIGIHHVPTNVKVTVFEQRADGADMMCGYQGQTKGKAEWGRFIHQLKLLENKPTVQ